MIALALPFTGLTLGGCAGDRPSDAVVEQRTSALTGTNGLAWNGLAWNGLAYNGLAWNGMAWNGLAWNGMTYNGMTWNGLTYNGNGLSDPVVQTIVTYLVSCALPKGDSVSYVLDGQEYTFAGSMGLAPEWKTSACGQSCQRWVSACMLARLNKVGEHLEISMRGEHPALNTERLENRDFQAREATYYGNLFAGSDQIYTCVSPGQDTIQRVCGDSLAGCPMNVVGSCDEVCAGPGRHRSFRDCATRTTVGAGDADRYSEAITVFLAP